jgi:hypothetical protein
MVSIAAHPSVCRLPRKLAARLEIVATMNEVNVTRMMHSTKLGSMIPERKAKLTCKSFISVLHFMLLYDYGRLDSCNLPCIAEGLCKLII